MDELLAWLRTQHNGLRTHKAFLQKVQQLGAADPSQAALSLLLATQVGRFIDHYEEQPLPVGIADAALARLVALLEKAVTARTGAASDQLRLLNEIAAVELG